MIKTELESFVQKFRQLRKAGINAHLDVHSEGSNAWACLRVQLGEAGQQQQHSDPPPPGWVKRGLRRSPAYARRQERRRAARQARQSAAEAEKQAEEMLAKDSDEPPAAEKAEEVSQPEVSVVVNSESRNVKPRDKWMKEDISLIESVIIDTVTSIENIENVYEDRFVRCRHCRRLSKDVHFYQHHCERQPTGYNLFYEDVQVLMHPDPAEVAAICSL